MNYTALGTSYQILLSKEGSKVFTDLSLTATTTVDTPYEVWTAISRGEMEGSQALAKQLYRVSGDFSLMMNWGKFFGGTKAEAKKTAAPLSGLKNPSMAAMLIPWISFWISHGINQTLGPVISLAVCAFLPFIMRKHRLIIWDYLSLATVGLLSLIIYFTGQAVIVTNIAYVIFGCFWLSSCIFKEPLCAAYVKYNFGGEEALKNPLFMKTNYIIACCWGLLYLLTAVWTFFLGRAGIIIAIVIINNLVPIVMGIFTGWFVAWYPAHLANRKKR